MRIESEEQAFAQLEIELRSIVGNCLIAVGLLILPHDERKRLARFIAAHADTETRLLAVPPHT